MDATENRLANEKSPYLLQHRNNPVAWHPWGEEAFALAKKESKPVFLSIGYSTCYWCHVMEQDSFERKEVAEILNQHYISIKVDREERPDLDQIYMDAIHALSGHGGWPMSVFLTPEKKPFWGGTFFYRDQFIKILTSLAESWTVNRGEIEGAAEKITEHLAADQTLAADTPLDDTVFRSALANLTKRFDSENGGFGGAPKFPPTGQIGLLLRIARRSSDATAIEMASDTLTAMAYGGIRDHLGGGFHRYSTDAAWAVPHFEKMLYDNALIANLYLEGYQATKNSLYLNVARETLDYILTRMTSAKGGFYSAEDAGGVGKEGEYYVWSFAELKAALTLAELDALASRYQISEAGNFEGGKNILALDKRSNPVDEGDLQSALQKLHAIRESRERPALDDKILTSWNGLTISAMAKGYQVIGNSKYLAAAKSAAMFIKTEMIRDRTLLRRYRDGEAKFQGSLDDYSALIGGLLALTEVDSEGPWLETAIQLQTMQHEKFWAASGYHFSDAKDVLFKKKDYLDGALPSGNSLSLMNLVKLHLFTGETHYREIAIILVRSIADLVRDHPEAFTVFLQGVDLLLDRTTELAVVGSPNVVEPALRAEVYQDFNPSLVSLIGKEGEVAAPIHRLRKLINGMTSFYLCQAGSCTAPTSDLNDLSAQLRAVELYSWAKST